MNQRVRGRWAFGLTVGAAVWALALIPAAYVLPAYGTSSSTETLPSGVVTTQSGSATLIGVNGASVTLLVALALPAVCTLVVWLGLHRRCSTGSVAGQHLATVSICVLAGLVLLTGFSIGPTMLPVLVLLIIAARMTPAGGLQQA